MLLAYTRIQYNTFDEKSLTFLWYPQSLQPTSNSLLQNNLESKGPIIRSPNTFLDDCKGSDAKSLFGDNELLLEIARIALVRVVCLFEERHETLHDGCACHCAEGYRVVYREKVC